YPLIIDPLIASTYIGGTVFDSGSSIASDSSGNIYINGTTTSSNFPTTAGAYDQSYNDTTNTDVFVAKFNSTLTTLLASTYIGGPASDGINTGGSLAIDSSGNGYIIGYAGAGFPSTAGAYDETYNGGTFDAFTAKFSSSLTSLLGLTFIGGSDLEFGNALALDSSGNVYIAVSVNTGSTDFPTTAGAYDQTHNGLSEAAVAKFNSSLTTLLASTFIGGTGSDNGNALALDSSGNVYLAGSAATGFPVTAGAYDEIYNGGTSDAFVSEFNSTLTTLLASTFLGGAGNSENSRAIAIDSTSNIFITGIAASGFPVTSGAYDEITNGGLDSYVSKLNSTLTTLSASTFLGG